jgi:hypothetical protein
MATKKVVKKSAPVKKAARRSPSARRRSSEEDKYWDDKDIVKGNVDYGDTGGNEFRPKRAGGAGGRLMKSPRALRMQGEAKWAEYGGRYENDLGVMTPWTKPKFGRTNPILPSWQSKNIVDFNHPSYSAKGPSGKLASKRKTKGKSGPTKKR